jgi:hypothetical protein
LRGILRGDRRDTDRQQGEDDQEQEKTFHTCSSPYNNRGQLD